jgi:hypothetical protein
MMAPMTELPDELTAAQAADMLGLQSSSTVARYVTDGKLTPSRKLPGKTGAYLFWRVDVEALRDRQIQAATS